MSLRNPRYERFAYGLAEGKPAYQAYIDAGFAKAGAAQSASRLLRSQRAGIGERVAEILQERKRIRAESTKLAIERSGMTKERVAVELGRIGFANIADYADAIEAGPDVAAIIRRLPREHAAALTEVWIDAQGNVRLKLGDKRAALMDIAKLFGWIVEKRENKIVDEFDSMTTEQLEAWLDERAEQRVRIMQRRMRPGHARRQPAGGVGTLRPTTARGKPH